MPTEKVRPILQDIAHRPWPLPDKWWIMAQTWRDLLFAHWPIPVEQMRPLVPARLELDTYDGQAWVGVVPFRMTDIRLRGLVPLPFVHSLTELNVRTYVRQGDKAGVYFFSLDADNKLEVATARTFFKLPYNNAHMWYKRLGQDIEYYSRRTHKGIAPAEFHATYGPTGDSYTTNPGTLEHWLTARYCLYAATAKHIYRGDIHHRPWSLQSAQANFLKNTQAQSHDIVLPNTEPLLHFSRHLEVVVWRIKRVA